MRKGVDEMTTTIRLAGLVALMGTLSSFAAAAATWANAW
jgi:hypothetical protein